MCVKILLQDVKNITMGIKNLIFILLQDLDIECKLLLIKNFVL